MLKHTQLTVSGDRFLVTYAIEAPIDGAREIASKICVEQTVEFPPDLVADDDIRHHIFGRIERMESISRSRQIAIISYAIETTAHSIPQLINVIYGNVSLFPMVRVERFQLPESLAASFAGPRFGRAGLRQLLAQEHGPLFMTALKPQGLSAGDLAAQAYELAIGGIDVIKDDHGLSDQPFARFQERVVRCAAAVAEANVKTGGRCIYAPMISSPSERLFDDIQFAKRSGARGVLMAPGLVGFDVMRRVAGSDEIGLPVIAHPAFLGSYVASATNGLAHYALFGQLMRLAGADATIFPNYGGRFSFSSDECAQIVASCVDKMNHFKSILPAPGGGMTFESIPSMAAFYGRDVMYLIGGDLHRRGSLAESSRKLRELATSQ